MIIVKVTKDNLEIMSEVSGFFIALESDATSVNTEFMPFETHVSLDMSAAWKITGFGGGCVATSSFVTVAHFAPRECISPTRTAIKTADLVQERSVIITIMRTRPYWLFTETIDICCRVTLNRMLWGRLFVPTPILSTMTS
jgi:hypothetical protein